MPRISPNSHGGGSTRLRCRCFLNGCDLKKGGRAVAKSTIHNHRKEDVAYYESLLRRGAPVPDELERALIWSQTRPEPIDLFKKTQPDQPEPNAAPKVEALPLAQPVVSTPKPEDRGFEELQDKNSTSRMKIIMSATHEELLHNPVYCNLLLKLCDVQRQLIELLETRIPAANGDTSSSGSNPPRQTQNTSSTIMLSNPRKTTSSRKAEKADIRHPPGSSCFRPETVLEHEFEDSLSYVRDVDEGKTLVVRLIRSSSWSHDSLDFRTLFLDKLENLREHPKSLYTNL